MPVIPFDKLTGSERLSAAAARLASLDAGVVLAAGQTRSGKLTTLMALATDLAQDRKPVTLLTDRSGVFEVFEPLPARWKAVLVDPTSSSWNAAFAEHASPRSICVVATLNRENAEPAFKVAGAWILAAVDTPLVGADVAYALQEMGVSYESLIGQIRCIWSQLLLPGICKECEKPAALAHGALDYLFPAGDPGVPLLQESGCSLCDWRGTVGRESVVDAMLFDAGARRSLAAALLRDEPLRLPPTMHVTMHERARELLMHGRIGVGTYRDEIRRNPLLRARNEMEREQARSFKLGRLFDKFLSPEVKQRLLDGDTSDAIIRGEAREVTCLFCDIRGFTSRAEVREPQELFSELNEYFAEVVDAVLTSGGTLDKFIGDAVMVVFGAPVDQPDHAQRAVECALAIRRCVDALNGSRFKDMPIQVGIGVNTGQAATGCVGTDERMEYTALGDAVNVAARLEAKAAAGEILIGDETRRQLGGRFSLKSAGDLALKGRTGPVQTFSVLGRA